VLRDLAAARPWLQPRYLMRNYGQTAALQAGFDAVSGRYTVTLDGDLQNDPLDIPELIRTLEAQPTISMISGWRKDRQDKALSRKLPSKIANSLIGRVTGVRLHDYGCTLKAYRREVLEPVRLYGEMHRFIPVYAKWSGARITEQVVRHHARKEGKSKYGLARTLKVLLDLMTVKFLGDYSTKPSYLFGFWGFAFIGGGFLSGLVTLVEKFRSGVYAHRNPLLLLAVMLFVVGIQLIGMGLLAELLVRTYHESQSKPVYLIAEEVNAPLGAAPAPVPRAILPVPRRG
jgi:glycosyltransferase involved in cell wall biosynthesis